MPGGDQQFTHLTHDQSYVMALERRLTRAYRGIEVAATDNAPNAEHVLVMRNDDLILPALFKPITVSGKFGQAPKRGYELIHPCFNTT
jgi:hypothetical protein